MYSAPKQRFATVLVRESQERFVVHEHPLTHYSDYFRAALTAGFKESKNKEVALTDTEPMIFEFFVHWLYYQRFPDPREGDDAGQLHSWGHALADNGDITTMNLMELYVWGDQRIVPEFQTDALDALYFHLRMDHVDTPNSIHIQYAFEWLRPTDPLCRCLIDIHLYYNHEREDGMSPYDPDKLDDYPPAFLLALACRVTQVRDIYVFRLDICDYHEHNTEEEKTACTKTQMILRAKETLMGISPRFQNVRLSS